MAEPYNLAEKRNFAKVRPSTSKEKEIMPLLDLSSDDLLATTRAVRKRLDFSRPVEPEVIRECLELALQAPTGGNSQGWQFVVVTDPQQRQALAKVYQKGWASYLEQRVADQQSGSGSSLSAERAATLGKVLQSAVYL